MKEDIEPARVELDDYELKNAGWFKKKSRIWYILGGLIVGFIIGIII